MSLQLASGMVHHTRMAPGRHAFTYRMAWILGDLDGMDRGDMPRPFLSSGPGGLLQMRTEDHLDGKGGSWREALQRWLPRLDLPDAPRVQLLTLPRMFGRTFNPVSFWLGRDSQDEVAWMIAEVNNTFGERHLYRLAEAKRNGSVMEWSTPKGFPVSPFNGSDGTYRFSLSETPGALRIGIDLERPGVPDFVTFMSMRLRPLNKRNVGRAIASIAFSVGMVVPRILWQAARIHFGKRAEVAPRTPSANHWTILHAKPVLLQRMIANPSLGRIWKRFGKRNGHSIEISKGAIHGT